MKKKALAVMITAVMILTVFSSCKAPDEEKIEETEITTVSETTVTETTVTETTVIPTENNAIEIVGGSNGQYYRAFCYNELCNNPEDKQIIDCYFIPVGTYRLTNNSGYPRQITVYNANSLMVNDNGFEEFSDGLVSDGLIADGQAVEVTIEPGYFLKTTNTTSNPDRLSLVPQGEIVEQDLSSLSSRFYEDSLFIDINKVPTEETTVEATQKTNERTVYVSNKGKYHYKSNCSGMKNYTEMSLSEAKEHGYEACKKCT